jgi:hypothetical protein
MPTLSCPSCIPIVVPDNLASDIRERAGASVRAGSALKAMQLLRTEASMSLEDAKAVAFHLARREGHCQKCDTRVSEDEYALCGRCGSLTISW